MFASQSRRSSRSAPTNSDAVLAQLVVRLMDDRNKGVREMARVARPPAVGVYRFWRDMVYSQVDSSPGWPRTRSTTAAR
jgi:hypothetical protein